MLIEEKIDGLDRSCNHLFESIRIMQKINDNNYEFLKEELEALKKQLYLITGRGAANQFIGGI